MAYSKNDVAGFGKLIKSIVGNADRFLHVGTPDMELIRSVMYSIPEAEIHVSNFSGELPEGITNVGDMSDLYDSVEYDVVSIPIASDFFSTAIYYSVESILREGGIVAIYGDSSHMPSRNSLIVAMIREGTISPFSFSSFSSSRGLMIFVLSNNVLVRNL